MTAQRRGSLIAGLRLSRARGLLAFVVASLFFLNAIMGAAGAMTHASDRTGAATAAFDDCRLTRHGDSAPAEKHGGHSGCCTVCESSSAPPHHFADALAPARAARRPSSVDRPDCVSDMKPYGFATSWSSQAPPAF